MASDGSIYEFALAVERVKAAVESAKGLPFTFTLTARCENFLCGNPDIADTIKRLQAYQEAGADVLYAPGLRSRDVISSVVDSVDKPVNVLMGSADLDLTIEDLSEMGVKRISLGSGLARAALGAFIQTAREIKATGTFSLGEKVAGFDELTSIFSD
jgi:2-methylisocitrate lyase-like PEP mutase family enzyme